MLDINEILNGPKKGKGKQSDIFNLDRIIPKKKDIEAGPISLDKPKPEQKEKKIIVHNHYYQAPNMANMPMMRFKKKQRKFSLSTLNGERALDDDDGDGYPNYMDPAPKDPNIPKKKLIWEKTLKSIYRSDRDD